MPGAVKGWEMLRARFGKLPMADLLAPAIFYADDGFPVTDVIANAWNGATRKLAGRPARREDVSAGGRAPKAGEMFKNPDARRTMRLIAEKGPAGFYEGKTAEAILALSRKRRHDDRGRPEGLPAGVGRADFDDVPRMDGVRAAAEHAGHRGADDAEHDGAYPLGEYGLTSTKAMHVMIEAKKLAYADMIRTSRIRNS